MDLLWIFGVIIYFSWKLHKRYPGFLLMIILVALLPVAAYHIPQLFACKNEYEIEAWGSLCAAIGICLEYPFIKTYLHFLQFVPPIKRRIIEEETEKIMNQKEVEINLSTPSESEIEAIVSDYDYFVKYYGRYLKGDIPESNPLIDPESIWFYKNDKTTRSMAIEEWKRRKLKKLQEERSLVMASCERKIENERWFKRNTEYDDAISKTNLPFNERVRWEVQSISPTDKQLAYFMSQRPVPDKNGKMTNYTQEKWLWIFGNHYEKHEEALALWREECANRIISSGNWPDHFHDRDIS